MKKLILSAAMVAFGTFAMAQENKMMRNTDPAQMEQKRAEKLKMMKTELNLNDAQVAKIQVLQDQKMAERKANMPKMQAERKAKMDAMKQNRNDWDKEMKQILTSEQYTKWQQKKAEKMEKKSEKMQMKGNKMQGKSGNMKMKSM